MDFRNARELHCIGLGAVLTCSIWLLAPGIAKAQNQCDLLPQPRRAVCVRYCALGCPQRSNLPACIRMSLKFGPFPCDALCGNGTIEAGEDCEAQSDCPEGTICDECLCREPVCGDGVVEGREECDPPDGSGCPPGRVCGEACTCRLSPLCGNGTMDSGEQCEPPGSPCGTGCSPGGSCFTVTCTATCQCSCGNMVIDPGEECDSSNATCPFTDDVCRDCICVAA